MHQDRLVFLDCILYEFVYGFCCCIFGVKNYLVLQIQPLEREIHYASPLPMILHLLSSAVDNVRNFVRHHKLLVLQETKDQSQNIETQIKE